MAQIAMVFAGQGAQAPGMGHSLTEASPAAAEVFRRVDQMRPGTSQQCFTGTAEELERTINTQPCLWAVEMAAAAALTEAGIHVHMAAGFSLGEIAALTYTGAADFETGFHLVCRRAELMEASVKKTEAAMAAVLKLDDQTVEHLCEEYPHIWPVNYNCPGQVAVAGLREELELFAQRVKEAGGRAKVLRVAGGFHSPLMEEAAEAFGKVLEQITLKNPNMPLYSNYTGLPYAGEMKTLLQRQISNPVRWKAIVEHMHGQGIDTFIEVGPGNTLSNLIARTLPDVHTLQVSDAESLAKTLEALQ